MPTDVADWDAQSAAFLAAPAAGSWRAFCDALHCAVLERWRPLHPPGAVLKTDLFDEAAGTGLIPHLPTGGTTVVGIDVAAATCRRAEERNPGLQTLRADVRRIPLQDSSVGLVLSNSTLDHFAARSDIGVALAELRRVAAPGATLLLTLDNLGNPVIAAREVLPFGLLHRLGLVPYHVGPTLTRRGLVRAVEAAGWRVEETRALLHVPRVVAVWWCRRHDRRAGGLAREAALVRRLLAWEVLDRLPTRWATAHFVAVRATAP